MTDTGLQKLKPGEKLCRRGDRDGVDVAVRPINRRKQIWQSADHTTKVAH
nr:integrase [Bradyrhizobium symbiodeficiens]